MWIEVTDENKRKVLVNLEQVTQITDSGEETDHVNYIFFFSILSNCYWVFDSKEEKEKEYKIIKDLLKEGCDHNWDWSLLYPTSPPKIKCIKCDKFKTI